MIVSSRRYFYIKILIGLFLLLLTCTIALLVGKEAHSTEPLSYSWVDNTPTVNYAVDLVDSPSLGMCQSHIRYRKIEGLPDYKSVCIEEGSKLSFGTYTDSNLILSAVGFPGNQKMIPMKFKKNICGKTGGCLYIPATDVLVTKQNLINNLVRSLVIYKDFSKRIDKIVSAPSLSSYYYFDLSNPDYIFQSTSNYAYPVEGIGASSNGKWLGVEFKSRGMGILNLETYEMKKISNSFLKYGIGMNPTAEIAISNNGKNLFVMGMNSSINIFEDSGDCGVYVNDLNMTGNLRASEECPHPTIQTHQFIDRFYFASHPRLNESNTEIRFYASSFNRTQKEVSLRVAGYNPIQLEYLAMGDSFTSGEGEVDDSYYLEGTNEQFEKCHVSNRSYPILLGGFYGFNSDLVKNVACSGGTTKDIIGLDTIYWGQGDRLGGSGLNVTKIDKLLMQSNSKDFFIQGRVHQINFVKLYKPKLVTVGIGGNDVGFMDKLKSCISPGICDWASSSDSRKETALELNSLFYRLVDTYQAIHEASSHSKVYAVGYPKIIKPAGKCSFLVNALLSREEREFMDEGIKYINLIIKAAANKSGIGYVDIEDSLGENVICGSSSPSAMNEARLGDDFSIYKNFEWLKFIGQESFHPNSTGHTLMSLKIRSSINNPFVSYCDTDIAYCPHPDVLAPIPPAYWGNVHADGNTNQVVGSFIRDRSGSDYRQKNASIDDYTFEPDSQVHIEVHSVVKSLGDFTINSQGGGSYDLDIPDDIEDGFHTVHITGVSYIGEPLDLYQVIKLQAPDDDENSTSGLGLKSEVTTNGNTNDSVDIEKYNSTQTSYTFDKDKLDSTDEGSVLSAKDKPQTNSDTNKTNYHDVDWVLFSCVFLIIGIVIYFAIQLSRAFVSHRK